MTTDEIRSVVSQVLNEQQEVRNKHIDEAMLKTVAAILTSFGIDDDDRAEIRADFSHLRRWRKSVEQAQSFTMRAAVAVIVSGIIGAVWLGFKAALGK